MNLIFIIYPLFIIDAYLKTYFLYACVSYTQLAIKLCIRTKKILLRRMLVVTGASTKRKTKSYHLDSKLEFCQRELANFSNPRSKTDVGV